MRVRVLVGSLVSLVALTLAPPPVAPAAVAATDPVVVLPGASSAEGIAAGAGLDVLRRGLRPGRHLPG